MMDVTNRYETQSSLLRMKVELWRQDPEDKGLWHGPKGVIVNTAALEERKAYYLIVTESS